MPDYIGAAIEQAAANLDPAVVASVFAMITADLDPTDVNAAIERAAEEGFDPAAVEAALGRLKADLASNNIDLNSNGLRDLEALMQLGVQPFSPCEDATQRAQDDTNGTLWYFGGCLAPVIAIGAALLVKPNPPMAPLVGKDEAYIAEYTDCYLGKVKSIRTKNVAYGCLTTVAVYVLIYVVLIGAILASDDF